MADDDLESLLARHKKEQKALVAQLTSLKKTVTKGEKSKRKEVLLEVERLEKELKERHERELKEFKSSGGASNDEIPKYEADNGKNSTQPDVVGLENLKLEETTPINRGGKPKVSRQKARMQRRAAEMEEQRQLAAQEAIAMPNLNELEKTAMKKLFETYSLKEESIRPDGNCLYAAFASQLNNITSNQYDYKKLRLTAASYIKDNKEDFEPFLLADDFSSAKDIDSYCKEIEETAIWGGEMEITAISRALDVPVEIYSNRSPMPLVINAESTKKDEGSVVRLAYYQHLYGLGQHYNALYKEASRDK